MTPVGVAQRREAADRPTITVGIGADSSAPFVELVMMSDSESSGGTQEDGTGSEEETSQDESSSESHRRRARMLAIIGTLPTPTRSGARLE